MTAFEEHSRNIHGSDFHGIVPPLSASHACNSNPSVLNEGDPVGVGGHGEEVAVGHDSDHLIGAAFIEPLYILKRLTGLKDNVPVKGHGVARAGVDLRPVWQVVCPVCGGCAWVDTAVKEKVNDC